MQSAFVSSGFVSTRVGAMTLIGLNTIDLTWGLECNNTAPFNNARAQMQQLDRVLATAKFAIISGHVPAGFWRQSCREQYALIVGRYRAVVKQHMYGESKRVVGAVQCAFRSLTCQRFVQVICTQTNSSSCPATAQWCNSAAATTPTLPLRALPVSCRPSTRLRVCG